MDIFGSQLFNFQLNSLLRSISTDLHPQLRSLQTTVQTQISDLYSSFAALEADEAYTDLFRKIDAISDLWFNSEDDTPFSQSDG